MNYGQYVLCNCYLIKLFTGKKHQIRLQFYLNKNPIIGDKKYARHVHVHHQPKGLLLASCAAEFTHPITKVPVVIRHEEPAAFGIAREALKMGWDRQSAYQENLRSTQHQ